MYSWDYGYCTSIDLFFYYLDDFFTVFKEFQKVKRFKKKFDNIYTNLSKKQLHYLIHFFGLEFNIVKIKVCLPKTKLKKAIQKVIKLLKKGYLTTHRKL